MTTDDARPEGADTGKPAPAYTPPGYAAADVEAFDPADHDDVSLPSAWWGLSKANASNIRTLIGNAHAALTDAAEKLHLPEHGSPDRQARDELNIKLGRTRDTMRAQASHLADALHDLDSGLNDITEVPADFRPDITAAYDRAEAVTETHVSRTLRDAHVQTARDLLRSMSEKIDSIPNPGENVKTLQTQIGALIPVFEAILSSTPGPDAQTAQVHDALFAFAGWMTTRETPLILSTRHDAAPVAELVKAFIDWRGAHGPDTPMPPSYAAEIGTDAKAANAEAVAPLIARLDGVSAALGYRASQFSDAGDDDKAGEMRRLKMSVEAARADLFRVAFNPVPLPHPQFGPEMQQALGEIDATAVFLGKSCGARDAADALERAGQMIKKEMTRVPRIEPAGRALFSLDLAEQVLKDARLQLGNEMTYSGQHGHDLIASLLRSVTKARAEVYAAAYPSDGDRSRLTEDGYRRQTDELITWLRDALDLWKTGRADANTGILEARQIEDVLRESVRHHYGLTAGVVMGATNPRDAAAGTAAGAVEVETTVPPAFGVNVTVSFDAEQVRGVIKEAGITNDIANDLRRYVNVDLQDVLTEDQKQTLRGWADSLKLGAQHLMNHAQGALEPSTAALPGAADPAADSLLRAARAMLIEACDRTADATAAPVDELIRRIEDHLNTPVDDDTVPVPAHVYDAARSLLQHARRLAGMNPLHLIYNSQGGLRSLTEQIDLLLPDLPERVTGDTWQDGAGWDGPAMNSAADVIDAQRRIAAAGTAVEGGPALAFVRLGEAREALASTLGKIGDGATVEMLTGPLGYTLGKLHEAITAAGALSAAEAFGLDRPGVLLDTTEALPSTGDPDIDALAYTLASMRDRIETVVIHGGRIDVMMKGDTPPDDDGGGEALPISPVLPVPSIPFERYQAATDARDGNDPDAEDAAPAADGVPETYVTGTGRTAAAVAAPSFTDPGAGRSASAQHAMPQTPALPDPVFGSQTHREARPGAGLAPAARLRTETVIDCGPGYGGLFGKYLISRADGTLMDQRASFFVLRIDRDRAARVAALAYAFASGNDTLADDLRLLVETYSPAGEFDTDVIEELGEACADLIHPAEDESPSAQWDRLDAEFGGTVVIGTPDFTVQQDGMTVTLRAQHRRGLTMIARLLGPMIRVNDGGGGVDSEGRAVPGWMEAAMTGIEQAGKYPALRSPQQAVVMPLDVYGSMRDVLDDARRTAHTPADMGVLRERAGRMLERLADQSSVVPESMMPALIEALMPELRQPGTRIEGEATQDALPVIETPVTVPGMGDAMRRFFDGQPQVSVSGRSGSVARPPLGAVPRWLHDSIRCEELINAITRTLREDGQGVVPKAAAAHTASDWADELSSRLRDVAFERETAEAEQAERAERERGDILG